jgi:hypothetical protein
VRGRFDFDDTKTGRISLHFEYDSHIRCNISAFVATTPGSAIPALLDAEATSMKLRFRPLLAALILSFAPSAQALDLSFTTFSLESGTGDSPVSSWRFDDIAPGVDGLMTLNAFGNGGSFTDADGVLTGGAGGVLGMDDIEIEIRGWADAPGPSYAEFTLSFVDADTTNATVLNDLTMISYDIDSTSGEDYSDTLWVQGADSIFFENPTSLAVSAGTGDFAGFQQVRLAGSDFTFQGGASSNDPAEQMPVTVFFSYDSASSITWRWGLTGTLSPLIDDDGKGRRMFLSGNAVFVPEPGTAALLSLGLVAMGSLRRRR